MLATAGASSEVFSINISRNPKIPVLSEICRSRLKPSDPYTTVRNSATEVRVSTVSSIGRLKRIAAEPLVKSLPNGSSKITVSEINGRMATLTEPVGDTCQSTPVLEATSLSTSIRVRPTATLKLPPSFTTRPLESVLPNEDES